MKTKKLGGRSASRLANGSPACGFVCLEHLQEAELIQSSLLPAGPLQDPSIDIDFRFTPFWEVGGDFTDFFRLPDGMIGLYLGDVVGKGLPATLYSALVMGTLRGAHKTGTDSSHVGVLFATDGLHEARSTAGIDFSDAQMQAAWAQCWTKTATASLDFLQARLQTFLTGSCLHDDVTAVALKVPHLRL